MKKGKRILAIALLAALVLCLVGCGSFETRMAKAAKKMSSLQTYHVDLDMQISMSMALLGQSVDMDIAMQSAMDAQSDPMRCKMDMTLNAMGMNQQVLGYFEKDGEEYISYASADGGTTWEKKTVTAEDLPVQSEKMGENIQIFIECAESFQEVGKEEINGSAATRYDGEISGESVQAAMDISGTWEILSQSMGTEIDESAFSDLGSIPCSIWIDDKSGMVVRYDMDMTEIMQSMAEEMISQTLASIGADGIEVELDIAQVTVSAVMSQFDQVGEIVIPDEAKAA